MSHAEILFLKPFTRNKLENF